MVLLSYNELTVGVLKSIIKDVPDDSIVKLSSDTGVDQGLEGPIVIENAYVTGSDKKVLNIYANEKMEDPVENFKDDEYLY